MQAMLIPDRLRRLEEQPEIVKSLIDHTNLRPDATYEELARTCEEAVKNELFGCCIPLFFVSKAREITRDRVKVVTVVGFPHGNAPTRLKVEEARYAMESGADEVDMVVNISLVKSGRLNEALEEVKQVLELVHAYGGVLKVIEETGYLADAEIVELTKELARAGVDFVKTSTGFGPRGASFEDMLAMRKGIEGSSTRIKAAGGIRTGLQALLFYAMGADRIGTSSGVKVVNEAIRLLSKKG
ncbi:MAG: deoxyribose-phosphate aldolase [Thermofilum sp.]|uniref:Deoxyribose-phosphate aldolase n=1 Tax=Thermofilum pendens TaxID=2269 RepID=A0A7C4D1R4_THEPE